MSPKQCSDLRGTLQSMPAKMQHDKDCMQTQLT